MPDHQVVIVGAGPVGLMLACLLSQQGTDVVVCEQRADADPRVKAIGIHKPGLDALDAAGLGEEVRAEALRLDGGDVISRGRTLASLDFPPERPVHTLPQQRTDALLRARLGVLSAQGIRTGCTVRAIRDEGSFVRVTLDQVDGRRELTATHVVAADGIRSPIRSHLGLEWRRRRGEATYAMADVVDPSVGMRAELYCEPGGLVESFPLPGGRRRWVARLDRPERALSGAALRVLIAARTGAVPLIDDDAPTSVFLAAQHFAEPIGRGRVILLGDAAHEISPIGGQGMNVGWLNAMRLSEQIARGAVDFRAVGRQMRHSATLAQRRSAFYMSMGGPAGGMPLHSRDALIRLLGAPALRAKTIGLITMRRL